MFEIIDGIEIEFKVAEKVVIQFSNKPDKENMFSKTRNFHVIMQTHCRIKYVK